MATNMASLKQPPVFDPDGGDSYVNWKTDIDVWRLLAKDSKIKQGPAIYLSLKGDAREAVRSIDVKELAEDDGVNKIIQALDGVFLKDETTRAFCAIKSFIEFRRESGQSFSKFILEFGTRYREIEKYKMKFEDGMMAYFLLASANLSPDHERLVRATSTLKYVDMKEKLQKVFGEFDDGSDETKSGTLPVKEECLFTKGFQRGRGHGRGFSVRGGTFGRGRGRGSSFGVKRGENPVYQGVVMRCHECDSTKHFVNECPHRRVENANVSVHLTLLTGSTSKEQLALLKKTLGKGILDTACTKTVAGVSWINEYLQMLSEKERNTVENSATSSNTVYRFGDGIETRSKKVLQIPLSICGKRIIEEVDVVDNEIPLLISRPTMSRIGMIVDTKQHCVDIDGKIIKLEFNTSGHYVMPVSECADETCNIIFHLENLTDYTRADKLKKAMKLHRQFAHASKERLIRLLKNGGCSDKEFIDAIEECCNNCQFCQKYKQAKPKPIVGLPKSEQFNEVVVMDLKEVQKGKLWILHLIDSHTRYIATSLIKSKRKEIVVERIFKIWIAYFGAPLKFHSDNGGEFANEIFREMNEKLNIETSTSPGESPFSNGVVERNNALLYETMMKTMDDVKCDMETALAWATSAKNSLQNSFGFSPNQLIFGKGVNLPSVENSKPPAMEASRSDLVRQNLNALHKARESYIKAESSERIKRALRHNVRTYSEVDFQPGEKVFYKRRQTKEWRGPAKVLGKESNFVLIRHGSTYYRCHPCQLMKDKSNNEVKSNKEIAAQQVKPRVTIQEDANHDNDDSDEEITRDEEDASEPREELQTESAETCTGDDAGAGNCEDGEYSSEPRDELQAGSSETCTGDDAGAGNCEDGEYSSEPRDLQAGSSETCTKDDEKNDAEADSSNAEKTSEENDIDNVRTERLKKSDQKPNTKSTVQYALKNGEITKSHVLSRQPKKDGKNKDWINVQVIGEEKPSSVNWNDVLWWREVENTEEVLVLSDTQECKQDIIDAKEEELKNLIDNDVFEWVEDEGQKAISTRWVLHEKTKPDGSKYVKARLVARGFEEKLADKRVESPTCSRQGLRMTFVIASSLDWELNAMDISSAFLQGNPLQRTVYVKPPTDLRADGKLWRLKRCLYGLSDAPREWYDRVCEEMKQLGGKVSIYDNSVFIWHSEGNLDGSITTHVDDFEYSGTSSWRKAVINKLVEMFKISKNEKGIFKYIGLNIEQNGRQVFVDQYAYIENLKEILITDERKKQLNDMLSEEERQQLRTVCGQLLWATSQTRPDVAFDSCQVNNYGKEPTVRNIIDANKAIKKLKNDKVKLSYPSLGDPGQMKVVVYGDGSHNSLPNGASQGGKIVFLTGNGRSAPISWQSKKLDRVTKSPLATEISAVADAADMGFLVASMTKEMFALDKLPDIELITDSNSLKQHLETKTTITDPRNRVDTARLREMTDIGEVQIKWVRSELMLADCLTKHGASSEILRKVLTSGTLPHFA